MALLTMAAGYLGKKAASKMLKKGRGILGGGKKQRQTLLPTTNPYSNFSAPGVVAGGSFEEGAKIDIVSERDYEWDPKVQDYVAKPRRRRRRALLTQSDKGDIAFLVGTLGKGQLASAAISALLSKRC